jgi:F0F1-type ATP synthase assembly protein I
MAFEGKDKDKSAWREASTLGGIGIELAVSVLIGTFVGYRADLYFKTDPWLMVVGLFIGAAAGFYSIYKQTLTDTRDE